MHLVLEILYKPYPFPIEEVDVKEVVGEVVRPTIVVVTELIVDFHVVKMVDGTDVEFAVVVVACTLLVE